MRDNNGRKRPAETGGNELAVPVHAGALFTYDPRTRVMVADASDLGIRPGVEPFARLYNDACDAGFAVRGKYSVQRFAFVQTIRDLDGDVIRWELAAIDPDHTGLKLHVVND